MESIGPTVLVIGFTLIALVIAVVWVLFPLLVLGKMNQMIKHLEGIHKLLLPSIPAAPPARHVLEEWTETEPQQEEQDRQA